MTPQEIQLFAEALGSVLKRRRKLKLVYSNLVKVTVDPAPLTGDIGYPCDFVILSINNTDDDTSDTYISRDASAGYDEEDQEIYYGFDGVTPHQLFPKETTFYIAVGDAKDISVRCSKKVSGERSVGFSCFKYDD